MISSSHTTNSNKALMLNLLRGNKDW